MRKALRVTTVVLRVASVGGLIQFRQLKGNVLILSQGRILIRISRLWSRGIFSEEKVLD